MNDKMEPRELISALADGQLRSAAFARAVEAATEPDGRETWQAYHVIGEVLRTGQADVATSSSAFLDKLSQRLAREEPLRPPALVPLSVPVAPPARSAANDGNFRWKMVAGFASVAAVAAVAWTVVAGSGAAPSQSQLAAAPAAPAQPAGTTVVAGERGVMIRDARLDEFLAAHRQHGGASALQMPAGFLRNATFEGQAR